MSRAENLTGWAQHMRSLGLADHTITGYVRDVAKWAHVDWDRLGVDIRSQDAAPRTIARELAGHAAFARWIGMDPAPFLRRPSVATVLPAVVPTVDEMRRFVDAETDPMWRAVFTVLCGCGLRVHEVTTLRWSAAYLSVPEPFLRVLGKGSKVRDVPMSDAVRTALFAWMREYAKRYPVVLPSITYGCIFPVSDRTVQRRVKEGAVRVGLPDTWHPHALRHGFGTAVHDATHDLRLTGDLLGHATIETTRIYAHVNDERRRDAVASIL